MALILLGVIAACDRIDGLFTAPDSPLLVLGGDCSTFTVAQCDALQAMFDSLALAHDGTPCAGIIQSARNRFDAGDLLYGGSSTTIWGYTWGDTSRITNLGFTDLGPTVIHEEAHHLYPEMDHEDIELLGIECGTA